MPVISSDLAQQLLASIEADRLVIFVGAGLSMAPPSAVPSAAALARYTSQSYRDTTGVNPPLPADNLEAFSEFLFGNGTLVTLFINRLVNWEPFRRNHNRGHTALADFLWSHAVVFAVTTNVDELIELASRDLGASLRTSLDAVEVSTIWTHAPLLKLHGCELRDPENTLWCVNQLKVTPRAKVAERVESSTTWLQGNLIGRDLIFIGFWSDWAYLNSVLEKGLGTAASPIVILVDPAEPATLKTKAPKLWDWASKQTRFLPIPASGSEFLDELRCLFSRAFMNRVLASSIATYKTLTGLDPGLSIFPDLTTEDAFSLRRDCCGKPIGSVTADKRPNDSMLLAGASHIMLLSKGGNIDGGRYKIAGNRVRVVNGTGRLLSQVQALFSKEPPAPEADTYVVCAGGEDNGGVPSSVMGRSMKPSIVRPGSTARWITAIQASTTDFGA